jgi:hypothetical protein
MGATGAAGTTGTGSALCFSAEIGAACASSAFIASALISSSFISTAFSAGMRTMSTLRVSATRLGMP